MNLRRAGLLAALTASFFQARCACESTAKLTAGGDSALDNQNDIAFAMAKRVALSNKKGANLVLSPLSINSVLSSVAARSEGATRAQLLSFLRFKTHDDLYAFASELVPHVFADGGGAGGLHLSFAKAIWHEKTLPLKPYFKEVVQTVFKATVHPADLRFKGLGEGFWGFSPPYSVDSDTRLIFANALYFKGGWAKKFDASKTEDHDFHLLNGGTVKVPFMTNKRNQLIGTFDGFKVLELLYTKGRGDKRSFSMVMFLPDAKDGLQALMDKVGSDSAFLDRHLPRKQVPVGDFRIPRFKISYGFEASKVLKGLGLELPFTGVGLTQMFDSPHGPALGIKAIYHKSFIEVNEEGTEAAAASVELLGASMPIIESTNFVADHPFMFVIRENTSGLVLFIGYELNPSQVAD